MQTALGLLEKVGYEGLTTRRLAQELDVKSPALYWHFENKRALADAVAAAMLSPDEWPGPETQGASPPEWLAGRAHAFRQALLAYRDGAVLHAGTSPDPHLLPGLDRQLAALVAYGMTPDDALRTVLSISRYTIGWVLEEQAYAQRPEPGTMVPDAVATPTLARAQGVVDQLDRDADFDFGLRALITGAMQHRRARTKRK